jgi:hypothetical protein
MFQHGASVTLHVVLIRTVASTPLPVVVKREALFHLIPMGTPKSQIIAALGNPSYTMGGDEEGVNYGYTHLGVEVQFGDNNKVRGTRRLLRRLPPLPPHLRFDQ